MSVVLFHGEQELLTELLSLRSDAIALALALAKTKQYANQMNQKVSQLKRDLDRTKRTATPEDTNKVHANALTTIADRFFPKRRMLMYGALTSAATGIGTDRSYNLLAK